MDGFGREEDIVVRRGCEEEGIRRRKTGQRERDCSALQRWQERSVCVLIRRRGWDAHGDRLVVVKRMGGK